MKNKFKKIAAMVIAFAMTLSMGAVAFAAVPASTDTFTATVKNVDSGLTVTAYQIVEAEYGTNGLLGYTVVDGVDIEDIEAITADEVAAIAKAINDSTLELTSVVLTETTDDDGNGTGTYTGSLGAGTWIILVSNAGTTIYNPMIVSGSYTDSTDADSLIAGSVDANGNFVEGSGDDTVTVYAKSTTTSVEKVIVEGEDELKGADYDIGDEVSFKITTTIPDYSDAYDDGTAVFTITDTMSEGLDAITAEDITVTVNGEEVDASEYTYTITISGQTSVIAFASDYILANTNAEVVVTYTTIINDSAALAESLDENTNEVTLTFTNENTVDGTVYTEEDEDIVYVYSFAITDELVKTSANGTASANGTDVTVTNALEGATFTIYTDADCTNVYTNDICEGTAVSDENGYISFEGLEAGTYYVTETEAPTGYYINSTVYKVVIAAEYNEDGTLASYTITISDASDTESAGNVSKYTITYSNEGNTVSASVNPTVIVDATQATLPSTGGTGIFVIVIASVCIFGACAIIVTRKKKATEE